MAGGVAGRAQAERSRKGRRPAAGGAQRAPRACCEPARGPGETGEPSHAGRMREAAVDRSVRGAPGGPNVVAATSPLPGRRRRAELASARGPSATRAVVTATPRGNPLGSREPSGAHTGAPRLAPSHAVAVCARNQAPSGRFDEADLRKRARCAGPVNSAACCDDDVSAPRPSVNALASTRKKAHSVGGACRAVRGCFSKAALRDG